jgi:hypothetical protein
VGRGSCGLIVVSLACGPVLSDDDPNGETQADATDAVSVGGSSEETGLGGTQAEVETGTSTSELDPLVGPESVHAEILCSRVRGQPGPHLWIEAYLDGSGGRGCSPPDGISTEFVLVLISQWDGESGIFEIGDEHPHRAALGIDDEIAEGSVSIEVAAPYALLSAHLDLRTSEASVTGDLDFSLCAPQPPGDPPCP